MKFQSEIKQLEAQETQKIALKVAKIVEEVAKKKDLDSVFETNSAGLLYVKNPVNLTEEIMNKYNAKYKNTKVSQKLKSSPKKNK